MIASSTMRAAVYAAPGSIDVKDVAVPEVGPADVLLRVRNCGICGSDVHSYRTGQFVLPGQVVGHEFVGETVDVVGEAVDGISVGERVTGFSINVCGTCFWCSRGAFPLCPELFHGSTGYGLPGAFAEHVVIRDALLGVSVHKLPDGLADSVAATVEPVSVAVGALSETKVQTGDQVVVLGAGPIGNACIQVAKAAGAGAVYAVETDELRQRLALEAGADAVHDPRSGDLLTWVQKQTGVGRHHFGAGGMADLVLDCAGVPATVEACFEVVRPGGTIGFVAPREQRAALDVNRIVHKKPTIVGCLSGDFGRAIALLDSGAVDKRPWLGATYGLSEAPAAFERLVDGVDVMKVVIENDIGEGGHR